MKFTPLTQKREVAFAYKEMVRSLKSGADRYRRTVGWKGGNGEFTLHWHPKARFWVVFSEDDHGVWCPFGVSDPLEITTASITCEINPPPEGINRHKGGVFLKDVAGNLYLAHSGKLGGGRKGIGKKAFFETYSGRVQEIEWPDGVSSPVVVLGRVGSSSFLRTVGSYIHAVDDFKSNITTGAPATLKESNPELSFTPEFEGKRKSYTIADMIESSCDHGTVVNRLHEELESMGYQAFSTPRIDQFVVDADNQSTHIFEVKTDQTTTSLYGAVGQLMLHTVLQDRTPHRIMVLPGSPDDDTMERLTGLGIRVLTYEWESDEPRFENLAAALRKY